MQYSRRAEELGADALMIIPPNFMPASPPEVLAYYKAISDAVHIPIFLQDVPSAPISAGMARQIAEVCEHVRYIKVETLPITSKVAEMVANAGELLTVFGGAGGGYFIEEMRRGSLGTMPFCSQPEAFVQVWNLTQNGEVEAARLVFDHLIAPGKPHCQPGRGYLLSCPQRIVASARGDRYQQGAQPCSASGRPYAN